MTPLSPKSADVKCPRCGQQSLLDTGGSEGPFLTCTGDECEWSAGPFNTLVDLRAFVATLSPPAHADERVREIGARALRQADFSVSDQAQCEADRAYLLRYIAALPSVSSAEAMRRACAEVARECVLSFYPNDADVDAASEIADTVSEQIAAAIEALPAPTGDWVLVPREPTKEMVAAGDDKLEECKDYSWDSRDECGHDQMYLHSGTPAQIYRAMVAATPSKEK
jgi:hypothetical protein